MQCTTAKQFASGTGTVAGEYRDIRLAIGFTYFPNFVTDRQRLQDRIVREWVDTTPIHVDTKVCTFMMGAPGSGKSTAARRLGAAVIDPDWFKSKLPEFNKFPRYLASGVVHREAALLAAMTQRIVERLAGSMVIDNASANVDWLTGEIGRLRSIGYRVELVRMDAPLETCVERCASRRRHVPPFVIQQIHSTVAQTFEQVSGLFDRVRTVHT